MTSREKVEEILKLLKSQGGHWLRRCNVIEQALTEARLEGEKVMRERAAKVSELIGDKHLEIGNQATILESQNTAKGIAIAGEMIAKAIRSQKVGE